MLDDELTYTEVSMLPSAVPAVRHSSLVVILAPHEALSDTSTYCPATAITPGGFGGGDGGGGGEGSAGGGAGGAGGPALQMHT